MALLVGCGAAQTRDEPARTGSIGYVTVVDLEPDFPDYDSPFSPDSEDTIDASLDDASLGPDEAITENTHPHVVATRPRATRRSRASKRPQARRSDVSVLAAEPEPRVSTPQPVESILDHVYFKHDEAGIEGYQHVLNAFAELATGSDARLVLIAHADSGETDPQGISYRRATNVKRYLLARGVPENRLLLRVLGATKPLSLSPTNSDMSVHNRCVQLAIEKRAPGP